MHAPMVRPMFALSVCEKNGRMSLPSLKPWRYWEFLMKRFHPILSNTGNGLTHVPTLVSIPLGCHAAGGKITKMMGTIESSVSVSQHQGLKEGVLRLKHNHPGSDLLFE